MIKGTDMRVLRQELHVSAGEVARQLGIHVSTVYLWENGTRKIPERHHKPLAEILHVKQANLIKDQRANCILRAWLPDEDRLLRDNAGKMPLPDLTALINARFDSIRPPRSNQQVTQRAGHLDCSVEYTEGMTLNDVAFIVGLAHGTRRSCGNCNQQIRQHWIETGLLTARLVRGRGNTRSGPGLRWQVLDEDFERFLIDHPYAYDWRRFSPGMWRQRAELISRRSPWKRVDEMLEMLNLRWPNIWKRRMHRIAHKRRFHNFDAMTNSHGAPVIHVDEIEKLRLELEQDRNRARFGRIRQRRMAA